jgi:hypothetical protein
VINQSQYDPDTIANKSQMKPNIVVGLFREIVDSPRVTAISTTRRYLFADPSIAPVLEVAFLEGQDAPGDGDQERLAHRRRRDEGALRLRRRRGRLPRRGHERRRLVPDDSDTHRQGGTGAAGRP